jgi:hypothetical protein
MKNAITNDRPIVNLGTYLLVKVDILLLRLGCIYIYYTSTVAAEQPKP